MMTTYLMFNGLAAGAMAFQWFLLTVIAGIVAVDALYCCWSKPGRKTSMWKAVLAVALSLAPLYPMLNLSQSYPYHYRRWFWSLAPWSALALVLSFAAIYIRHRELRDQSAEKSQDGGSDN